MGVTIYDRKTGEARECETVDAREILESSPELYSAEPVAPKAAKAPKVDPLDHDEDGEKGGAHPPVGAGYDGLTVPKLRELAERRKVDLGDAKKRDDIVAALELADEAAQGAPILTRTEIEADLTAMEVDFHPGSSDGDLMALRDQARVRRDADAAPE